MNSGVYEDKPMTPLKKVEKKDEEPKAAFRPKGSKYK